VSVKSDQTTLSIKTVVLLIAVTVVATVVGFIAGSLINGRGSSVNNNNSSNNPTNSNVNVEQGQNREIIVSGEIELSLQSAIDKYYEIYPNTTIAEITLEKSRGAYHYNIEGVDDNTEFEIRINAMTGEAQKMPENQLDRDERNGAKKANEALNLDGIKTISEISEIAIIRVGSGSAVEWSLDREHGVTYWTVDINANGAKHEVEINAQTNEILSVERD